MARGWGGQDGHRDLPVALVARSLWVGDSGRYQPLMVDFEVIGVQEEGDPSASLLADVRSLLIRHGSSQQQPGGSLRWGRDDPSLVGADDGVLDEMEAQQPHEEGEPIAGA